MPESSDSAVATGAAVVADEGTNINHPGGTEEMTVVAECVADAAEAFITFTTAPVSAALDTGGKLVDIPVFRATRVRAAVSPCRNASSYRLEKAY